MQNSQENTSAKASFLTKFSRLPKKGGLAQFAYLRGRGLAREAGSGVFEGGLIPQCTLWCTCVFKAIIHRKKQWIVLRLLKNKNIYQWQFVCVVECHAPKYFFHRMAISSVLLVATTKKFFRQPWWRPLVNTSLISQFCENVSSFNFLANALYQLLVMTPLFFIFIHIIILLWFTLCWLKLTFAISFTDFWRIRVCGQGIRTMHVSNCFPNIPKTPISIVKS